MMDLRHFANLHGRARIRKAVLLLERIERQWDSGSADRDIDLDFSFAKSLAEILLMPSESDPEVVHAAHDFLERAATVQSDCSLRLRALNTFRHRLMSLCGQSPADWDFIEVPRSNSSDFPRVPGMRVYLEDIRSPFNVGSIFRTAEAFGFEEIILSSECADPCHARARRSAMGAIDHIPWKRASLESLFPVSGIFALEIGGMPLSEFEFPLPGLMILGSEELGVSASALKCCDLGVVEIPLTGTKASLNVATAFGIAGYAWSSSMSSRI